MRRPRRIPWLGRPRHDRSLPAFNHEREAPADAHPESEMSKKSRNDTAGAKPAPATPQAASAPPAPPPGRRGLLVAAAAATVVAVAGGFLYLNQRARSTQAAALAQRPGLASPHAPTLGDAAARVQIVEFLDPACETCALFFPVVKRLIADNPGRIRLATRHVAFHEGSGPVVAMLEASRRQDKYWQTLEALLTGQGLWVLNHVASPELARQAIAGVGLDMTRLFADMAAPDVAQRMARDRDDASLLRVTKTPEYFVNGRQMASFGRQQLLDLVGEALRDAY